MKEYKVGYNNYIKTKHKRKNKWVAEIAHVSGEGTTEKNAIINLTSEFKILVESAEDLLEEKYKKDDDLDFLVKNLWKAYPDGYLGMRGVTTIGEWHISETWERVLKEDPPGCRWIPPKGCSIEFEQAMSSGDLLPNLDPESDPASWACALVDLYQTCWPRKKPRTPLWEKDERGWFLIDPSMPTKAVSAFFNITADDPAAALVLAKISLLEKNNGTD